MSYRTFKRVLGETKLEWKFYVLFGFCLATLIVGSFWYYSSVTENLVYESTRQLAKTFCDTVMLDHEFRNFERMGAERMGNSLLESLENKPDAPKSSFIGGVSGEPTDSFEAGVLQYYQERRKDEEPFKERLLPAKKEYQYFQPVRLKSTCVICHKGLSDTPLSPRLARLVNLPDGDLAAVLKIAVPDNLTREAIHKNWAILMSTGIGTTFLAMVASWFIVRYIIVKPLKHLRDVSDAISHGNTTLRADIHTGDEFEQLGIAFNRMLRQLTNIQEELRNVNAHLNFKVDELAQANMRLYEMNRLKSDFLATMSHELRTPLNAIIGFSDVLESIASLDEKQKRYVRNIQTSGKMLLEMINDILDLAKIESGKMEVRLSDFHIEQVVAAQCDMARPLTERKNIDLESQIEPNLVEMFQDQAKVQQILNNLLSNAIKFTPEGGRIVISAIRSPQGELILTVADTGVGIAEEDQIAIFEKFRQGKSVLTGGDAMTREYSGTGLGLSIVKELCKLLGGEISLQSELGKGSTFTVRLPWVRADQPKLDAALAPNHEEPSKSRRLEAIRQHDAPLTSSAAAET